MTKNFEQLKMQMDAAVAECIWVPNDLLPERYQDHREGGSTLERLDRIYNAEVLPNMEYQQVKAEKAERIEKYAAQYEAEGRFDYDVNEHKLYRNEQSFCSGMLRAGLISEEDLDEDE
tara:strand:- start:239 stop:592 length:354 start_codon:yes stop_codon:yes gene_type:complete